MSMVVALFVAATAGKRYAACSALALCFVWTIWLAPVACGYPIPSVNEKDGAEVPF